MGSNRTLNPWITTQKLLGFSSSPQSGYFGDRQKISNIPANDHFNANYFDLRQTD
jgi:hypothetical protein